MIHQELRMLNPQMHSMDENTKIASHLKHHQEAIDSMWGNKHIMHDVATWGATSHRNRNLAVSWIDINTIPGKPPVDVNLFIRPPWRAIAPVLPCIVASEATHNPALVYDCNLNGRQLEPAEAEMLMSYPRLITAGPHGIQLTPTKRREFIGDGVHYLHPYRVFRELPVPAARLPAITMPLVWAHATQEQFELHLAELRDAPGGLAEWMRAKISEHGYELPPMKLISDDPSEIKMSKSNAMRIPPKLWNSVDMELEEQRKRGWMLRGIPTSHKWWVTPAFAKPKEGRFFSEEAVSQWLNILDPVLRTRLLGDYRFRNATLTKNIPAHWFLR